MLRREHPGRRRLAGIVIVVTIPVVVTLATLRPSPTGHERTVRVIFDEAKGVAKVERDVRVSGVDVGKIGEVRRVGDDAELELRLDEDAGPVYADATAELRPHSVFEGSAYVDLHPGTPAAGPLGDRPIGPTRTKTYVSLDQSLRGFDAKRRAAASAALSELSAASTPESVAASNKLLSDLPATLRDGAVAARAIRGPKGTELSAAIGNLAGVAGAVASRADRVPGVLADARQTMLAVNADDVDATLAELPATLRQLRTGAGSVTEVSDELRSAAHAASPLLKDATPLLKSLTPSMARATPALRKAPDLLDEMRLMLTDLQRAAKPLEQLLIPVGEAVDDLNERALPAMAAKSRLGEPAYQQFLSAGAGLTGAISQYQTPAQNPSGWGHFVKLNGDVVDGLLGMVDPQSGGTP